jgi:predicted small secreted protein
MRKFLLLAVFVMMVSTLTGCETIKGVGQDLSNLGDSIKGIGE